MTTWDEIRSRSEQASLFDLEAGKAGRDEGMAKVMANTVENYRTSFSNVVRDFRSQRLDFTSEDITARIGFPPDTHPNAIGALTRSTAMRFGAKKVGRVKAQRSNQHATEIALWGWR